MAIPGNQIKHIMRRLRRSPMFTAITLVTLAIGIGANTAVFSVIEGVLLKPLPYAAPDELVGVWLTAPGIGIKDVNMSPSSYFIFREESRVFQDIGLYSRDSDSVTGLAEPEQVPTLNVTDGVLPLLGVQPILGRWFTRKDDSPGSPETIMLSYGYWQRKFASDRSVIGRRIDVNGRPREVIGVLPSTFRFLDTKPALLLPFRFDRGKLFLGNFSYEGIARLKPGVTLAQANADVARMLPIMYAKFAAPRGLDLKLFLDAHIAPNLRPLKQDVTGDIGNVLWVLMGTIGIVLLIACANVANLLLVRAEGRHQELAIRTALGADRRRIAADLLFESVSLGMVGGALGLGVAYGALSLLVAMGPASLPRLDEISIDPWVLLFALAVSAIAGVLFGLIPVFKYAGPGTGVALRQGGRTLSQSRERHRARSTLVVVQVALAMVLLIGSGLMIRTFEALRRVQPGFTRPQEIQTLHLFIPAAQVKEAEQVVRMQQEILRKIAEIPGVQSSAFATSITMDGNSGGDPIFPEDRPYAEGKLPPIRRFKFASPGFLRTVGNPLLAGRDFTWTDLYEKAPVAIVTENLAREYWREPSAALGKRIRNGTSGPWREIIGVAGDERDEGVNQKAPTTVYWPALGKDLWGDGVNAQRSVAFAIRSGRTGSETFLKEIQQAIWSVNPNLPLFDVRTLDEIYTKSIARTSFTLVMLAIAGGMALLLGVVGIYGVISYSVSQRTREIGIRMALGARERELTGMFVRHGLLLAMIGLACGFAGAVAATRLMSSLLFEIKPVDPLTYGAVAIGLAAAAALASYLPSRRAASVEPVEALRAE
ncbi:MAG: ABC transporter permease [Bryobacteraceae bacterium]|jgi:putative ABC transport system permease protein